MALRILHVLSSNFFAGSVAYALQLAERQRADGHLVVMATDQTGLSDSCDCLPLPVSDRSLLQRFRNIRRLRSIIRDYDIGVVHAHSRAASWICHYALRGTRVPLISTIHGRQVKHSRLKSNDIYGEKVIAICPELVEQLATDLKMERSKLHCLPNPLDFEHLEPYRTTGVRNSGPPIISVVGRFNGPKGAHIAELVAEVFPGLLHQHPDLSIRLIGGEWESFPAKGKEAFDSLRSRFGERISYRGFTRQVLPLIAESTIVIGAGRVAMEALALGCTLFALGEACCHGIITRENLEAAIGSNFGDIRREAASFHPDCGAINRELVNCLNGAALGEIDRQKLVQVYDMAHIMPQIIAIYGAALMGKLSPSPIPVLMYHRVPDTPIDTKHRTFVTKQNFEKHLIFFARRGLQAITFQDYLAFATGTRPPQKFPRKPFILTFDDGYADNFTNALPLTRAYGFRGVLFLLGDFTAKGNFWDRGEDVEANRLMTSEQKKAFVAAGWEIGAHTMTHPHLTQIPDEELRYELCESRRKLEEELETSVISCAYPFGTHDERVRSCIKECGFTFGIATDTGGTVIEDDRFAIFRVNMFPEESFFSLYKKTSSWYRAYYRRKRGK